MLNREKLASDIYSLLSKLFPDLSSENDLAKRKWLEIASDDGFAHRVQAAQSSFLVPKWEGDLTDTFAIRDSIDSYTIVAVDGSQIYPDRHISGAGCFLLNMGGVVLSYGKQSQSKATFFSEPKVLMPEDVLEGIANVPFSRDLVDLKREEFEFAKTVEMTRLCEKSVCFVDGSIIFWPLEGKLPDIKTFFINRYLHYLEELYQNKILIAGYISMSKSRELVSLIKLGLCRFTIADCIPCHSQYDTFPCKQVEHLLDTHVARFFLKTYQRTTVFYSTSKIVEAYPEHLRPAFVYCDVGSEIIRLEVPSWIAQDKERLDHLCSIAIDQSKKGRGYPVCLAEAHEQAVVKGGDREFFYHLLCKIGLDQQKTIHLSQKAIKKRGIGI